MNADENKAMVMDLLGRHQRGEPAPELGPLPPEELERPFVKMAMGIAQASGAPFLGNPGVTVIPADKRPPGVELVPGVEVPEGHIAVRPIARPAIVRRPLDATESALAFRRLAEQRMNPAQGPSPGDGESLAERREREAHEADVVAAARRSQAEIRRHVDTYLKEHFETIAADVANVVIRQVDERLARGLSGQAEAQAIGIDRIAADVRRQLRAFMRGAWYAPKAPKRSPARRAAPGSKKPKARARGKAR